MDKVDNIQAAINWFEEELADGKCWSGCPQCNANELALIALKERLARSVNPPLTLEELRGMDGEPVWVQSPGAPEYGRWVIVVGVNTQNGHRTLYCQGDYTCRDYGKTWFAYRRSPEGGEG